MSDVENNRAGLGMETGAEDGTPGGKKSWRAPRITRLDGRSAQTGLGGVISDSTNTSGTS
jgi:hypothetical protein